MARADRPTIWARIRAELGCTPAVAVVPSDNILIGWQDIMGYLSVHDKRILERWIDEFGLPVISRPDGRPMTSITSIDQWILLAAKVTYETKFREGKTTIQKRDARLQKWRQNGANPTVSEIYRYGITEEINEFRQSTVHRPLGRVAGAGSQPGSSEDPSRSGPTQVHAGSSEPLPHGRVQRKDRD